MNNKKFANNVDDIAIVGIACRYPGANNYKEYWDNLANARNSIREITPDRWDINQFYSTDINEPNKSISKWGGLLDDIDKFDSQFFNISPQEANAMDPQQRLLLEETWHCIEDSGIALPELQNKKTSVYVGVTTTDYQRLLGAEHITSRYDCLGNFECILSNRLSYFFNFTGDSESIDAACASSLVSIHAARRSLLSGESDYAIAAGVSVICHPWKYISISKARMLSTTGQCKTFDATADGYVPGEGVGVLLLEPLKKAIVQRHQIYGVLKGSAVKHSGKSIAITAPRVEIEREVIEQALKKAHVDSKTVTYVEAHGTGTSLGDPIEVEALKQAFHTKNKQYCMIGSVKTNIGHLEAAAGIAGVIKVLLMFKNQKIPPTLNITTVNPMIDFENSPFKIANQLTEWQLPEKIKKRRAGVSSFGFGGVNAHIVLEEYNPQPQYKKDIENLNAYPFLISAVTAESLKKLLSEWQSYVKTNDFKKQSLGDICYTIAHGREVFSHRCGALVKSKAELVDFLNSYSVHNVTHMKKNKFILLKLKPLSKLVYSSFHQLCQDYPVLKSLEDQCLSLVMTQLNNKILSEKVKDFIVLYILGSALIKIGLKVSCIMGEGVGEIAAATISGMIDLQSAFSYVAGISEHIIFKRPNISFYSSQDKKIIPPYQITEQYCQALATSANIDDITGKKIIEKCKQLEINQFTFKKYIADWAKVLSHHHLKIESILKDEKVLNKETRLLLLIVLISCIKKLNKKWHLENKDIVNNDSVNEILDLLDDNVLSHSDAVDLILTKNVEKYHRIAEHLQKHQYKLNESKSYKLLKKHNQDLSDMHDFKSKVALALQDNYIRCDDNVPHIENQFIVDIGGQKTAESINALEDASNIRTSAPAFLIDLWCKDVLINWRLWFSSDKYDLVSLPGYQFTKEHHWISEKEIISNKAHSEKSYISPIQNNTPIQTNKIATEVTHNQSQLKDEVCKQVVKTLSKITRSDKIDPNVNLSQFGMDSIAMTEFSMELDEYYGIELTPAVLFEHGTLNSFVDYLIEKYSAELLAKHKNVISKENLIREKPKPPEVSISSIPIISHDIAIIGMSGLFPGSDGLDQFWENIVQEKDMITEIPKNRWDWKSVSTKTKVKWGGFVDSLDQFDPLFFNISPREAELMDPQQRKLIEIIWKAIENAGYSQDEISFAKTGVFVGASASDYAELLNKKNLISPQIPTGVLHCMLANRVSYLLNLNGPSEIVDTACSSSLVAIHHAVHSILMGDCDIAIAGGVNALFSPSMFLEFSQAGMLSEDGHCKTFDKSASGYVRGEGVGAIVLKSLEKALADNDTIYGVIKGTAVNHGGHVNSLTVPNPNAQAEVIMRACERAKISVDTINYIEAHGTGTPLGDPIEINGLKKAFQTLSDKQGEKTLAKNYCGLGSVKSNIGHLEGAAGIASVIKVLLAMKHNKLPGTVHYKELNPYIDIKDSPFYIIDKTRAWTKLKDKNNHDIPLRAGISSFGFGGTNAHVIIEEAPQRSNISNHRTNKPFYLVTLSAKEESELKQKVIDLIHFLQANKELALENVSYTLNKGRAHFEERYAMVVHSIEDLIKTLKEISKSEETENSFTSLKDKKTREKDQIVLGKIANQILLDMTESSSITDKEYYDNLLTLANYYIHGFSLDWDKLHHNELKFRLPLPTYPFSEKRYWFSSGQMRAQQEPEEVSVIRDDLSQLVKELNLLCSDLLKVKNIDSDAELSQIGLDSIMMIELLDAIEEKYQVTVEANTLIDYSSITRLAKYLLSLGTKPTSQPAVEKPISKAQPKKSHTKNENSGKIAIISMAGRFPESPTIEKFWDNLYHARELITEIPKSRWSIKEYYSSDKEAPNKSYSKWGGHIEDIEWFDANFFETSEADAIMMDPPQRILLEVAQELLDRAGYTREELNGKKISVMLGSGESNYQNYYQENVKNDWRKHRIVNYIQNMQAARIAKFYNLLGAAFTIDTACSSSLVAIHEACKSLLSGESEMVVAGGAEILIGPFYQIDFSKAGVLSDDGKCYAFDERAKGMVLSEGVGLVLLKKYEQAIEEGDQILGIVLGSAINNDGKTSGLTVPSLQSQKEVVEAAIANSHVTPDTISYYEAHGTGTLLGDPIEVKAISEVYRHYTDKKAYCGIGSVKSNMGHALRASGIASFIKVLLAMQNKIIPPTINCEKPHPRFRFSESPFYPVMEPIPWTEMNGIRRAAIAAFGFGGTNCHLIMEEYNGPKGKRKSLPITQMKRQYYWLGRNIKKRD